MLLLHGEQIAQRPLLGLQLHLVPRSPPLFSRDPTEGAGTYPPRGVCWCPTMVPWDTQQTTSVTRRRCPCRAITTLQSRSIQVGSSRSSHAEVLSWRGSGVDPNDDKTRKASARVSD